MKIFAPSLLALLSFAAAPFCPAQKSEPVKIKVQRPAKKGDTYETKIAAKSSMKQDILVGGKAVQNKEEKVEGALEGLVEVLGVDEKGSPTNLKVTVASFTMKSGDDEKDTAVLPSGKVIVMEKKDKKKSFTVDGEEADAKTAKLLGEMFDLGAKEKSGDEEAMFGLDKPRSPGSAWDIDLKVLIEKMGKEIPFIVDDSASSGKMNFKEIRKVGGVDCAVVEGSVKLKISGMKGLPEGSKVGKANIDIAISGEFPVDATLFIPHRKMAMNLEFAGNIPAPDGAADLVMTMSQVKEEGAKPVRK